MLVLGGLGGGISHDFSEFSVSESRQKCVIVEMCCHVTAASVAKMSAVTYNMSSVTLTLSFNSIYKLKVSVHIKYTTTVKCSAAV